MPICQTTQLNLPNNLFGAQLASNRVMVTGGRGFIGTHLVDLLVRNGLTVFSVDTKPKIASGAEGVVDVVGDLRDKHLMKDLFSNAKFDCVFDLASLTEGGLHSFAYRRNIEQTECIIEHCLRYNVHKYLFYSTQFVFRNADVIPCGDDDYAPTDAYGESKVKCEQIIKQRLPKDGFLILRPTYVWGPGLERFRDGLLYRLLKGQLIISNNPDLKRYYGYVETVAAQTLALSRLSFTELPKKVYYISDDAIRLSEFCNQLLVALGRGRAWPAPAVLIRLMGDVGALMSKFGLRAPITPLQARELTTNFPVPVDPTLQLTRCVTDLPAAAAKTVAWAGTDKRFASIERIRKSQRFGRNVHPTSL